MNRAEHMKEHRAKRQHKIIQAIKFWLSNAELFEYRLVSDNNGNYAVINISQDYIVAYGDIETVYSQCQITAFE